MTAARSTAAYRLLVRAYPRSFRDAYGADMVAIFEQQLADGSLGRVWARTLADLVTTIPARHLEARMPSDRTVPTTKPFASLTVADAAARWWAFVAGGVIVLTLAALLEGATDLTAWFLLLTAVVASVAAIVIGLVLGLAHLAIARRATQAA